MIRISAIGLFLLFALMPAKGGGIHEQASSVPMTVRLYNFADVGRAEIESSRETASRVLAQAGVGLNWLDCTIIPAGTLPGEPAKPTDAGCNQVTGQQTLVIRVMPARMMPSDLPKGTFGFAMLSKSDPHATIANVYFDRIRQISDGRKVRRGVLLGNMIAHEIGHLLLGAASHSGEGIMHIPWGPRELRQADLIQLSFSPKQASRMQANVISRTPDSD